MSAPLGSYERSLRERYSGARQRLAGSIKRTMHPIPPPPPPVLQPEPMPSLPVTAPSVGPDRPEANAEPPDWRVILDEVCAEYGVRPAVLKNSWCREVNVVRARRAVCARMYREIGMSLKQIGSRLGGLDHSSVRYAIRRHEGMTSVRAKAALDSGEVT